MDTAQEGREGGGVGRRGWEYRWSKTQRRGEGPTVVSYPKLAQRSLSLGFGLLYSPILLTLIPPKRSLFTGYHFGILRCRSSKIKSYNNGKTTTTNQ